MENLNYSEAALCTSDTKLAAILLAFGFRLMTKPYPVAEWAYEFGSKEDFLAWKSGRQNGVHIFETATWNIACAEGKSFAQAQALGGAYRDGGNSAAKLKVELEALGLEPAKLQRLQEAIRAYVVQMCCEVLDRREDLVRLLRNKPKEALWIVVRDPQDKKRFAKFGANASNRTIEECLNAL